MNKIIILANAIENKSIINIRYNKDGINNIRLKPICFFKSKNNNSNEIYLAANVADTDTFKNYKLSCIESVEKTNLKFSFQDTNIYQKINKAYFKYGVKAIGDTKNLNYNDNAKGNQFSNVIEYFTTSLRDSNLCNIAFYKNSSEYYSLKKENLLKLLLKEYNSMLLGKDFSHLFKSWNDIIKNTPDLSLYIAYPLLNKNNMLFPVFYYEVEYNVEKNSISLKGNRQTNPKITDNLLELTEKEEMELFRKPQIELSVIEKLIEDDLEGYEIENEGLLFLHKDNISIRKLIEDIKSTKYLKAKELSMPLKHLLSVSEYEGDESEEKNVQILVDINSSQEEAIIKSLDNAISVIQGPPGTGKTQTIINMIAAKIIRGEKILIASTNNKAVDNVYEKLNKLDIPRFYLRLGNKANQENEMKELPNYIKQLEQLKNSYEKMDLLDINEQFEKYKNEDKEINTMYKEVSNRIDRYYSIKRTINKIKQNLDFEKQKLIIREVEIPEENTYKSKKSKDIKKYLSTLEEKIFFIEKKINGELSFGEKIISKFINFEKYICKKIAVQMNKDLEDKFKYNYLLDILNKEVFINRYILTKVILNELSIEIKTYDINKLLLRKEKFKIARREISYKLIEYKILKNLDKSKLNTINLDVKSTHEYEKLTDVFPVIITTNHSAANSIPAGFRFDTCIIDEASQCDIPVSISSIKASNKIVIIGDDKQLQPVVTLTDAKDEHNAVIYDLNNKLRYKNNSLFKLCKSITDAYTLLDEHYRCNNDIIGFSNEAFYDSKLKIKTQRENNIFSGVRLINIKGKTEYGTGRNRSCYNTLEANAIFEHLKYLENEGYKGSIGIISPFRRQIETIENRLKHSNSEFFNNIEYGTVHTFQGNEKDMILFSTVISLNAKERTIEWIDSMETLINVAITRAKESFSLFADKQELSKSKGILNKLVTYISDVGEVKEYKPTSLFDTLKLTNNNDSFMNNDKVVALFNPYEKKLFEELKNIVSNYQYYNVYPKIRVADVVNIDKYKKENKAIFTFGLKAHYDYVIFDERTNIKPICAIELDGKYHNASNRAIINDDMKNQISKEANLKLVRLNTDEYLGDGVIEGKIGEVLR